MSWCSTPHSDPGPYLAGFRSLCLSGHGVHLQLHLLQHCAQKLSSTMYGLACITTKTMFEGHDKKHLLPFHSWKWLYVQQPIAAIMSSSQPGIICSGTGQGASRVPHNNVKAQELVLQRRSSPAARPAGPSWPFSCHPLGPAVC